MESRGVGPRPVEVKEDRTKQDCERWLTGAGESSTRGCVGWASGKRKGEGCMGLRRGLRRRRWSRLGVRLGLCLG